MKNTIKKIILIFICILVVVLIGGLLIANYKVGPYITNVERIESKTYNDQLIINVYVDNYFFKLNKDVWCYISKDGFIADKNSSEWQEAKNGYCSFTVPNGEYSVYVRDKYGNVTDINKQKVNINRVTGVKTNKNIFFLYKGQKNKITYELETIGSDDNIPIVFKSSDDSIVSVDNDGNIEGLDYGEVTISVGENGGFFHDVKVYVSKNIVKPTTELKPLITCNQFSKEEAKLLDQTLFDRVEEAGYGTRAGAIAAARFLTLEFAYRVPYFFENGRMNNFAPYLQVDGEGRYYHRGLYLSTDKYNIIEKVLNGPTIWGCDLMNYTDWSDANYSYRYGYKYPNGLDCSGFVTWSLINGGIDVGDIGAGLDADHYDLSDIGTRVTITDELMASGRVKVGDLIGHNGHAAILIGWDDNNYYIAEALPNIGGVRVTTVNRSKLVHNSIYKFIILMDDVYKKDGNYTNMW